MKKTNINTITPYRMAAIVKTASEISGRMVNGKYLYSPSWEECCVILDLVRAAIHKCKEIKEDSHVSAYDNVEKDHKTGV